MTRNSLLTRAAVRTAGALWPWMQRLNAALPAPRPFAPDWADKPIPRGAARCKPPTGWPRQTDSLCPECVKETRTRILSGELPARHLAVGDPGLIEATIGERDGQLMMDKHCDKHGDFSELLSIDPQFTARMEALGASRDVTVTPDGLHDHGASSLRYGRGGVLTVDLTNRCNMMCEPCFMDANQVGYVHELDWEQIKRILDASASVRPRRQMSVQFSGGEPTLSPHFLDAIRYARKAGYFAVQCATNGLRFAQEPGFAAKCKKAGLRIAYLQFDGVTNAANSHRKIANLYAAKLRAIEELAAAGIDVILVVTVVRGMNNDQVGPIVQFAVDNADKITVVSFQPVSFTGRDEDISPELRRQQRYTLSHLVHDVAEQAGVTTPLRDWYPLSALSPFGDVCDLIDGPARPWGQLKCGCHPSCGMGTVLFVHKETKQMVPLCDFLDMDGVLADTQAIFDAGRGGRWAKAQLVASLLRNFRPEGAPAGFGLDTLVRQFMSQTGVAHAGEDDAAEYQWRVLFVAGMAFQDLFNYDLRRTEMCIIPYGTEEGEISFCAYNTGVGWRNIIEQQHANCTVADWYKQHGKHRVYANGKPIPVMDGPLTITEHPSAIAERQSEGPISHRKTTGNKARRRKRRRLPVVA